MNSESAIIWATYDLYQAETVQSALMAQNISCDVAKKLIEASPFYLLIVRDVNDAQAAIDFVWRGKSGLCLRPDWAYPAGKENTSFKKWLNAI